MKKLLIRASQSARIMSEPRNKADKEAGLLGETAKTFVEEIWLKNNYGYEEPVFSNEMMKGLICEQDAINLAQQYLGGEFRTKNIHTKENDYVKGTPDIVLKNEDFIEDVKSSYTIKTFFNAELSPIYYYQALCYMKLFEKNNYRLIYCLNDTPEEIINEEKKRIYYRFGCDEENIDYISASRQIEKNHHYSNLPVEQRIKIFEFKFNENDYNKLCSQIEKAREYYLTIKLK